MQEIARPNFRSNHVNDSQLISCHRILVYKFIVSLKGAIYNK